MASFIYQARDPSGRSISGDVEALDEHTAATQLMDRGLMVVTMRRGATRKIGRKRQQGKVKPQDLVVFTRQLATMMDAGLPLVQSLTALEEQTDNKAFKSILRQVTEGVEKGQAFSEALTEHPRVFNRLYVSMVEAGETGGLIAEILDRLASYLESTSRLKKKVKSAMTYPVIVCFIAISIALFLILKVIPIFGGIYKDFGAQLPGPTQVLIHISDILRHYFLLAAATVAAAIYGFVQLKHTKKGAAVWDRIKLRLPVFGKLIHKIAISRFSRTFAALLRSGVPILETLRIVGQSSGNTVVEDAVEKTAASIERGDNLALALRQHSIFPPMLVRMVSAGEQTGKVDVMLEKISDFYDEEIEATLAGLTSLIEPLLILFLGVVVGSIVICMFLPIFKLNQIVQF
ncbi:MAG TPA: type II secretion system F family protein [Verrucomicrobiae bacterium]|nr:type II secretion system F family protein [Verrucomicrobiae bacterium]